jgi:hypothetical protein
MNLRHPTRCNHRRSNSSRINTSEKSRRISLGISTSKTRCDNYEFPSIRLILKDFNPTRISTSENKDLNPRRINTSGNKDLKFFRINTSKKHGRGCPHLKVLPYISPCGHPESHSASLTRDLASPDGATLSRALCVPTRSGSPGRLPARFLVGKAWVCTVIPREPRTGGTIHRPSAPPDAPHLPRDYHRAALSCYHSGAARDWTPHLRRQRVRALLGARRNEVNTQLSRSAKRG